MISFGGFLKAFGIGDNGSSDDSTFKTNGDDNIREEQQKQARVEEANQDQLRKTDGILTESTGQHARNQRMLDTWKQGQEFLAFARWSNGLSRSGNGDSFSSNYGFGGSVTVPQGVSLEGGDMSSVNFARQFLGVNESQHGRFIANTFSGGRNQAWCADFVSTCLNKTGGSPWGHRSGVSDINSWAARNGRQTNVPQAGDAAVFSSYSHIGIVGDVQRMADGRIRMSVIQGNTSDAVKEKWYVSDASGRFSQFKNFIDTDRTA